ncbi:MAG: hypothetical protein JXM79_09595 [Sedimentisphaerales bacterium]|nr:hypothetical protein [Sedimentisphaerales bacterium]
MTMKENIKSFIRDTLGCNCPEEVFQHIESTENVLIQENLRMTHRIDVGGRLLIYIYNVERSTEIVEDMIKLILHGQKVKKADGYNRFRLVLVSDDKEGIDRKTTQTFDELQKDENIHLHIISTVVWDKYFRRA